MWEKPELNFKVDPRAILLSIRSFHSVESIIESMKSIVNHRLPYVWDYDIDEEQFREILAGQRTLGRLDRDWAALRLLEYAPYEEIVRLIGFPALIQNWPHWKPRIRSKSRRRGFDFLVEYLPDKHPDLCRE